MGQAEQQHLDWLARTFASDDYEPLNHPHLDLIRTMGEAVSLRRGKHLFEEGEAPDAVYYVEDGEVEVYRGRDDGRRKVAEVGPGSLLGDLAVFVDRPHAFTARATSLVHAYRLERGRLLTEMARNPGLAVRWLVAALRRLEGSQRRVIGLLHQPILCQVADLLLEESLAGSEVHMSQATIGSLLGVSRQSINEALSHLRDAGAVETGYRRIRIIDAGRLAEFIGS